jgi:DNA-binding LytR/AlgR family response regulator
MTFAELEMILPRDKFIRTHRSYIAAYSAIEKIERHQVHIQGNQIPVSESFIQNLNNIEKR